MTDAEIRKRIKPVAIQWNADLLAKLGLLEQMGGLGGFALYRISAHGVLECEQKGIQPDPVLLGNPDSSSTSQITVVGTKVKKTATKAARRIGALTT